MDKAPVITIDGPSGSGKGTMALRLTDHLDWHYLDSGSLYRVLAYEALQHEIHSDDVAKLVNLIKVFDLKFSVDYQNNCYQLSNHGADITTLIRSPECTKKASEVSSHTEVRQALLEQQRLCRQSPGLVTDGRDMGTVVFPDAELKIFLSASVEVRAQRRLDQLIAQGIHANLRDVQKALEERDYRDTHRSVSPLKPAEDAICLDSSTETPEQSFQKILELVAERFN